MTLEQFIAEVIPMKDKLYRLAKRIMGLSVEAEDVIQDVYMKLWTRKGQLGQYQSLEAFAMTVTKNHCLDQLRSHSRKTIPLEAKDIAITPDNPHGRAEAADGLDTISRLMDQLPEQQKLIMHMRDIEGYSMEEIKAVMGLNENVIRVNLSRARKKIREQLNKTYAYGLSHD